MPECRVTIQRNVNKEASTDDGLECMQLILSLYSIYMMYNDDEDGRDGAGHMDMRRIQIPLCYM